MTNVIFIHLGPAVPSSLLHFATELQNAQNERHLQLVLITDQPQNWDDFPGLVLRAQKARWIPLWYQLIHFDRFSVAKGYWRNTLMRLFILGSLHYYPEIDPNRPVIHIESDVLLFACPLFLSEVTKRVTITTVVSLDQSTAIAAIVVAKNANSLSRDITRLRELLLGSISWKSDMDLLALGIRYGYLASFSDIVVTEQDILVVDGWPYGQFLFGQDPILNDGTAQGGYVSPFLDLATNSGEWVLTNEVFGSSCNHLHLALVRDDVRHFLFNLHVHSKRHVGWPTPDSLIWQQTILAANGIGDFPSSQMNPSLQMHLHNGNLAARVLRKIKHSFTGGTSDT